MTEIDHLYSAMNSFREEVMGRFDHLEREMRSSAETFGRHDERIKNLENETPPPLPVIQLPPAAPAAAPRSTDSHRRSSFFEKHVLPRLGDKLVHYILVALAAWISTWFAAHGFQPPAPAESTSAHHSNKETTP